MHNEDAEGSGAAAIMAPLVVYLMSTRCASATPWNHRDHLRTRVAPAAAAYGARLEHPIVAVVDECSGEELPTCERCAPSPLAPLVSSECTNCDGIDVIVANCPGGNKGRGPGCKTPPSRTSRAVSPRRRGRPGLLFLMTTCTISFPGSRRSSASSKAPATLQQCRWPSVAGTGSSRMSDSTRRSPGWGRALIARPAC